MSEPFTDVESINSPKEDVTCKRCGKEGLEWVDIGCNRWVLYDGMKPHICGLNLDGF